MAIIDEQGRVLGRVNAVDAAVAAAVVVLIPVAYAAYVLFRPAPIKISGVEPPRVVENQPTRVHISGEHLRPYLTAQFGTEQLHSFLIATPTQAEADVPKLPPGTYDLKLFDETQQVAELKNALTVVRPEVLMPVAIRLAGVFVDLDAATAKTIVAGMKLGSEENASEVMSVGAPAKYNRRILTRGGGTQFIETPVPNRIQVPATIRVMCAVDPDEPRCKMNGAVVAADQTFTLAKGLTFVVRSLRPDVNGVPVDVVMQVVGRPEVIDLIKVGDRDLDPEPRLTVTSVQRGGPLQAQTATHFTTPGGEQTITRSEQLASAEVRFHAITDDPAMQFNGAPLKAGETFALQTARYVVRGLISRVTPSSAQ